MMHVVGEFQNTSTVVLVSTNSLIVTDQNSPTDRPDWRLTIDRLRDVKQLMRFSGIEVFSEDEGFRGYAHPFDIYELLNSLPMGYLIDTIYDDSKTKILIHGIAGFQQTTTLRPGSTFLFGKNSDHTNLVTIYPDFTPNLE